MASPPTGTFDRAASLGALRRPEGFDVLVIGGGITGCGVALDAASRGLSVALVERHDFASGTSSKSSKLIHGGLRYLQQKEFLLVYENLHERQRLLRNAPHLVSVLPFLIPVFGKNGVANKAYGKAISSALWLYDLTGGWRVGKLHKRIDRATVLQHMPTLRTDRLVDGFLYYDARADDARLTLTLARTAAIDFGAVCVNHLAVTGFVKDATGMVTGVQVTPTHPDDPDAGVAHWPTDGTHAVPADIRARCVVNAAGVWADEVRTMDEGRDPQSIRPAKGIHITVPAAKLPCDIAAVVTVPKDKRSIFVVPWDGETTYIGTTDTDYHGSIDDPQVTADDITYVLDAINASVSSPLTVHDVTGTWAGLRPLLVGDDHSEKTKDLSRRHAVNSSTSGIISITGGKLTTYRKMAQDTVDAVTKRLGTTARCATKRLPLRGAPGMAGSDLAASTGLHLDTCEHLVARYGTEARAVAHLAVEDADLAAPLVVGLPTIGAEVVWAVIHEAARTLDDVLARRTRARLLARDASADAAPAVAAIMAPLLGWSPDRAAAEIEAYVHLVDAERTAPGLPRTNLVAP